MVSALAAVDALVAAVIKSKSSCRDSHWFRARLMTSARVRQKPFKVRLASRVSSKFIGNKRFGVTVRFSSSQSQV